MIIVTGAAGFIGRNLVEKLRSSFDDEIVTFDFVGPHRNPTSLFDFIKKNKESIKIIFHNGACSDTTQEDLKYVLDRNADYTIDLVRACVKNNIRLIYASSASVYGDGPFCEGTQYSPKNFYAVSKSTVDMYCSMLFEKTSQLVGLRYFNVYGKYEENKGEMASVVYKFYNQMKSGNIQLFENSDAYLRDFVYIDDVIEWNLFFYRNPEYSGIYNVGTGVERSFEDIANIFKNKYNAKINYIPMPEHLREKYQEYTKSDNSKSLEVYNHKYNTLEEGVEKYLNYLESC